MTYPARYPLGQCQVPGQLAAAVLDQRPDIADGANGVRAEMAEAGRTYAMGLAALRQAAELTQAKLARRLGVTQATISCIEQPHDLLLSTLNSYLGAIGSRASVIEDREYCGLVEVSAACATRLYQHGFT